jgi:hypothetical protein
MLNPLDQTVSVKLFDFDTSLWPSNASPTAARLMDGRRDGSERSARAVSQSCYNTLLLYLAN